MDPTPAPDSSAETLRARPAPESDLGATRIAGSGPPVPPAETREKLGPYRLLKRLGSGGMGQIFLAEQESVGRQVALKVLPPGLMDGHALERFQREIKVLGQLGHPHICPVLEAGVADGAPYYAMEYLRGMDLAKVLRNQRVDARRAAGIAVQVSRALHFAHGRGVVHRDVKPLNIMLMRGPRAKAASATAAPGTSLGPLGRWFGRKGSSPAIAPAPAPASDSSDHDPTPEFEDKAVLIDFGLARDGQSGSTRLTVSGEILGTPAYMAPEQARGEGASIGPRTDVYSLGATLYEMLTLAPPFSGQTPGEILHKVLYDDPMRPRALNPLVDRDLETVVQKAMEKEPARRYESAEAMAEDLERWLAGEPIRARRASIAYRIRRKIARNKLASAGVFAVAAALLGAAWFLGLAPGTLEILPQLPAGAGTPRILVDGRPYTGEMRVWPGSHRVEVELEGFTAPPVVTRVTPGQARRLDVRLTSIYGTLEADTDPPGAEVRIDGTPAGSTPFRARALVGKRRVTFRLPEHEPLEEDLDVMPGVATTVSRRLSHERGTIRVTSEPGPASLWLKRAGASEDLRTSGDVPITADTGRWAGVATARNCFPVRFACDVRKGETARVHVSPPPMASWELRTDSGSKGLAAADLDADGLPDVVVLTRAPRRVWAIRGTTGRLLWMTERPEIPDVDNQSLAVADFDGDLVPDICVPDFRGRILVLGGADGSLRESLDVGSASTIARLDDLDGDGLDDLFVSGPDSVAAWSVRLGRRLWSIRALGGFGGVTTARLRPGAGRDVVLSESGKGTRALDGRTGATLWTSSSGDRNQPVSFAPAPGALDRCLLVTYANATLVGPDGGTLGATGGTFHGRAPGALGVLGPDRARLLVQNSEGFLQFLDASTAQIVRKVPLPVSWSPPALADVNRDGTTDILVASDDRLVSLDGRNFEELWAWEAKARVYDPLLLGDFDGDGHQDVVVSDELGNLTLVRAEAPDLLWKQASVGWSLESPALVDGTFVVPGDDRLRCLRASDGAVLAEAPSSPSLSAVAVRVEGRELAVVTSERESRLVEPETGKVLWEIRPGFRQGSVLADGRVVAGGEAPFRGLDAKTGHEVWASKVNATSRARFALLDGVYWVPSSGGVLGVAAADGSPAGKIAADGNATSVTALDGDLVFGTSTGKLARATPPSGGKPGRLVWTADLATWITPESPAADTRLVAVITTSGKVVALDAATGAVLWSTPLGDDGTGGPSLHDLDADGRPEVAAASANGLLQVLRGTDGSLAWSAPAEGRFGPVVPLWADADGDGAADLVTQNRNGYVTAWRVRPPRSTVFWPDRTRRTDEQADAATSVEADDRQARQAAAGGRTAALFEAAGRRRSAVATALAARAARRAGDGAAAATYARQARELGCRALDVRAIELAGGPDRGAFAEDLLAASDEALLDPPTDPELRALWKDAASLLQEAPGREDRALLALGAVAPWDDVAAAFDRFRSQGANPDRLLLARGRIAFRQERDDDAREAFAAVRPPERAAEELARLAAEGETLRWRGVEAAQRGKVAAGLAMLRRASKLRPDDPAPLNELAFFGATSRGCSAELARECVAAAERAVALHEARAPEDQATRAWYLDTLAAACFAAGEKQRALDVQREAMALPYPRESEEEMRGRLRKYEEAVR